MHTSTSTKLKDDFMLKYSKDFKITRAELVKSLVGMEIEQSNKTINTAH
jgi:hypothetical protein